MKILVIGRSTYELNVPIKNTLVEGTSINNSNYLGCGGGSAANSAYLLGKWHQDVYLSTVLGNDDNAKKILNEFRFVGVKTDYIESDYDNLTSNSIILTNLENKVVTKIDLQRNDMKIKKTDYLDNFDIILTDGYDDYGTSILYNRYPNAKKVLYGDIVSKGIMNIINQSNVIIMSKEFALKYSKVNVDFNDVKSIAGMYSKILPSLNGELILFLDGVGIVYQLDNQIKMFNFNNNLEYKHGYVDVFNGALVYGFANDISLEENIKNAMKYAEASCKTLGARISIPEK